MIASWNGRAFTFETRPGLFSPSAPDAGTLAMLSKAEFISGQKVLDLGCGWGFVGVAAASVCGAANVVLADLDPEAVAAARENCAANGFAEAECVVSDGLSGVRQTGFDWILSNPPYHADFSVPKAFIEKGFNRLRIGGRLLMVAKRRDWYKNKIAAIFGGVRIEEIDGYFVFEAEKRDARYASRKA